MQICHGNRNIFFIYYSYNLQVHKKKKKEKCVFFPIHKEGRAKTLETSSLAIPNIQKKTNTRHNSTVSLRFSLQTFTKLLHCKILSLSLSLFAFHTQHTLFLSSTLQLLTYLFNFQLLFGCGGNWVFFADSRFIFVLVSVFLVTAGWRLRSFLCLRFGHSVPRFAVAFAYFVAPRVYALL